MPFGWVAAGTAVAGLAGSVMQSNAVEDAQDSANDAQRQARDQARGDLAPWVGAGNNALGRISDLSGANGRDGYTKALADFEPSPGYQFRYNEGLRAIDAGAAAGGYLRSGAQIKAEQQYGQGLASSEFDNYYNRLSGLANLGQSSAAGQGTASLNTGAGIAQTNASAGGAQASIYGNAASGIGNQLGNYANNSLYSQRTNALGGGIYDRGAAPQISNFGANPGAQDVLSANSGLGAMY